MSKHNLELLAEAAGLLKPLLGELVFVGGSTTALFITDKAAAEVRPTYDVDAIAEVSSYAAYADFSERLPRCGFTEDTGRRGSDLPVAAEEGPFWMSCRSTEILCWQEAADRGNISFRIVGARVLNRGRAMVDNEALPLSASNL